MAVSDQTGSLVLSEGSFVVQYGQADQDSFSAALGHEGREQPGTFAIRLLAEPPIAEALAAAVSRSGAALFHEAQSFSIQQPLPLDEDITVDFTLRRELSPARLIVDLAASDDWGKRFLALTATMRLVMPATAETGA